MGSIVVSNSQKPGLYGRVHVHGENGATIGGDPALQAPKMDPFADFDKKGPIYAIGAAYHQLLDDAGMCALYTVNTPPPDLADLISQVTGWDFGWQEALKAGRRILTLRQAFNAREGITPDQINLPERITSRPLPVGSGAPPHIDFQMLKDSYFKAMGWDTKTGLPSKEALDDLGLSELVEIPE